MQMNKNIKNNSIFGVNFKVIILLFSISCLYLFENEIYGGIGYIATVIILVIPILYLIYNKNKIKFDKKWNTIFLFLTLSIIPIMFNNGKNIIYNLTLQTLIFIFVLILQQTCIGDKSFKIMCNVFCIIYFVEIIFICYKNIAGNGMNDIFEIISFGLLKNLIPLSYFLAVKAKYKPLVFIFTTGVLISVSERGAAIAMLGIWIVYFLLRFCKKCNRKTFNRIFFIFYLGMIMLIMIYVLISISNIAPYLDTLAVKYTHQRLFSGRDVIWASSLNVIFKSIFWGYGIGSTSFVVDNIECSPHNIFIHILLQAGVFGFIAFSVFLYYIWQSYFYSISDSRVRLSAAYFIGILLYASSDAILISNNIVLSLYMWLVISVGIMIVNEIKRKEAKVDIV